MDRCWDERLRVPWWWWLAVLACAALLAAELYGGYGGWRAWVPYVVVGGLAAIGLAALCLVRVRVEGGELWVRDAHLPLRVVSAVTPLDAARTRQLLAEPSAFVVTRPWVPCSVRVDLDDPDDDTPYWLVSTRRPNELAATIERARALVR